VKVEAPRSAGLDALLAAYRVAPEGKIFAPLADAYRRAGRLEDAAQVLEKGTAMHPDYVSALVLLALVQRDLGHDTDAEATLDRVLALDPENLVALKSRATRALVQGEATRAEALVEKLYGLDPYDRDTQELRDAVRAQRNPPPFPSAAAPEMPPAATLPRREPPRPAPAPSPPSAAAPWNQPPTAAPTPAPPTPLRLERPAASLSPPTAGSAPPSAPPSSPSIPAPSEWDVQRDADRIVIRPRPLSGATPLPTPSPPRSDEFSTLTLARIYESQGYVDKAMAIYVELQRRQPGNPEVEARLQALRQRAAASPPPPDAAAAAAQARWRLLEAETPSEPPQQQAAALRDLTETVRERERSKHHTQIGRPPEAPPPSPVAPAEEPDFERFLRYVRSLKRVR